jgi:hypothetical protein
MARSPKPKPRKRQPLYTRGVNRLIVKPLTRQMDWQSARLGQMLEGVLLGITHDRQVGTQAILEKIGRLEESVERIAQEMARQPDKGATEYKQLQQKP